MYVGAMEEPDAFRQALLDAFAVLRAFPPHRVGAVPAGSVLARLLRAVPPDRIGALREVQPFGGMHLDHAIRVYLEWIEVLPRSYAARGVPHAYTLAVRRELLSPARLYGLLVDCVAGPLVGAAGD